MVVYIVLVWVVLLVAMVTSVEYQVEVMAVVVEVVEVGFFSWWIVTTA